MTQTELSPALTLGPPVAYVPVCPANHCGGPGGYTPRPKGDDTQYLVVSVKRPEAAGGSKHEHK